MTSESDPQQRTSDSASAMPKAYDPQAVEGRLYHMWEDGGYFAPKGDAERDPFVIIMPPPNLTGELHVGHALMDTVEDILIRWHRMLGEPTLWLPGIDHAAIAVHTLVERELAAEGLTRYDVGRGRFLERVWAFVNDSRARIFDQHKRLGVSADWSRERFTMDPGPAKAVRTAFYELYRRGLIYRGERIINWCPRCDTALSDLEVDHQEQEGYLWHVRYPLLDDEGRPQDDFITIATTRPETIVADTGVAVSPEDERYRAVVGRRAQLPIIERELPIVADEAIELEFGTGALKVTPGHDPVDFEIGQRHDLPAVNAIEQDGTMSAEAGPYAGMERFACRDAIVSDLEERGLLVKTEPYTHAIGHCQRCAAIVEPLISEQWFMAVNKEYGPGRSLAGEALAVVNDGLVHFLPPRFTKIYTNWMENIRDWCISRQLWWGHRIPVWYCEACGAATVPPPEVEQPDKCDGCGGSGLHEEEDTLDTWFSSALWPCSTLGWPEDTDDLRRFYPTTVMETGYEIIFFWVAKMIMMGLFCMDGMRDRIEDRIPFRFVYLHGMVRDEHAQKMSKTKGNVVDPIDLVKKYGADALRFNLVTAGGTGQDQRLWEEKVEAGRNFANKLWNVTRFVVMQLDGAAKIGAPTVAGREALPIEDRWILSRLDRLVGEVDQQLRDFQLNEAGHRIYDFLWGEYCDWYVEMAKVRLGQEGVSPLPVLVHVLETGLRLLHPYMPFVTEELWQRLRPFQTQPPSEALIVAPYPQSAPAWRDEEAEAHMDRMREVVRYIRDLRSAERIPASALFPNVRLAAHTGGPALIDDPAVLEAISDDTERAIVARLDAGFKGLPTIITNGLKHTARYIERLAKVEKVEVLDDSADLEEDVDNERQDRLFTGAVVGIVTLPASLDAAAKRARLSKEIRDAEAYLKRLDVKLSNEQFRRRAPTDVVAREEERRVEARSRVDELRRRQSELR